MSTIVPGITVSIIQSAAPTAVSVSFASVYIFGFGSTGTKNQAIAIRSATDFTATFGASPSTAVVTELFIQNPQAKAFFVRCEDPGVTAPTAVGVLDKAHLIYALTQVVNPADIGFVIAPEFFQRQTAAAERTAISNALGNWGDTNNCVPLVDVAEDTDTDAEAGVISDAYAANPKPVFLYYPYTTRGTAKIPASVYPAAFALKAMQDAGAVQAGAGVRFPIVGATPITMVQDVNASALVGKRVNPLRKIGANFYVYDVLSLGGKHINTRIAEVLTVSTLNRAALLFRSFSPSGTELQQMISELDLTMQQLQAVGCFSLGNPEIADGLDADKAYEIRTDRILPVDGAGFIDVVCRFVYTLRAVNITLRSV